ncbi:MAG: hypothetical protein PHV93_03195 [Candidatus Pacebacteria bacterium]|nr:hypothetical protein [Candidatus Paceibacterota bacterium]
MKNPLTITILIFLIIIGAVFLFWPKNGTAPIGTPTPSPVACTMEAKICPDGSSVGRVGPNCEFAECPGTPTSTQIPPASGDVTLSIGQKGNIGALAVTLNIIIGDSRCPTDVVCIQAGTVNVSVTLSDGTQTLTRTMSLSDAPYSFGKYQVSITSVTPARESQKEISAGQYRITFHVTSQKLAGLGERCGGNMLNAPVCQAGLQCVPDPASHLPFGDVGGTCARESVVNGSVTLSPVCPVEKIPPDPACAPKPYQTTIEADSTTNTRTVKTTQSGSDGSFSLTLPYGDYTIQATGGNPYPRCSPLTVSVKAPTTNGVNISCDTGIR